MHTKVRPRLKTTALEQFQESTRSLLNPSLKKWKDTGAELLSVIVAGSAMPREQYNKILQELVDELSHVKEGHSDHHARLMLIGGILDDPACIEVIEGQGGLVVTDFLCFGPRTVWKDVDEKASDPITALARYYIADRPSRARMFGGQPRTSDWTCSTVDTPHRTRARTS